MRKVLIVAIFLLLFGLSASSVLAQGASPRYCTSITIVHREEPDVATIWYGQSQTVKVYLFPSCGNIIAVELVSGAYPSANVTYGGFQTSGVGAIATLSISPLIVPRTPIKFNATLTVTVNDNRHLTTEQVQVPITLTSDLSLIFPNNMTLFQKVILVCAIMLAGILCIILGCSIVEKRKIKKKESSHV